MGKRLIGNDGKLTVVDFGTDIAPGSQLVIDKWYQILGVGDPSCFPDNVAVGYLYQSNGMEVLEPGDTCRELKMTDMCDIQNWSLDFSKNEIDVSGFCDANTVYRAGKVDVSGNIDGVMQVDVTDIEGGFMNGFVTIVKQTPGAAEYEIFPADDKEFYVMLYTDDTTANGTETNFYFCPVILTGFSASASTGDNPQTFASPFRVAPSLNGVVFYKSRN